MGRPLTAVGCNIFAGGFTLGVEKEFKVLAHLEHDAYGVATFRLNRPTVPVLHGPERWGELDLGGGELDLIYANPPCAIVSVCGRSLTGGAGSWRTDPRTQRHRDIVDLALRLRPRILAVESVVQLYTKAPELIEEHATRLGAAGYGVSHLLVDNAWHGVPQRRRRYYTLAHRVPLGFERLNWAPPSTVGEILRGVPKPGGIQGYSRAVARAMAVTRPGGNLRKAAEKRGWPTPAFLWHRLHPDELGRPIISKMIHPSENRPLGFNEALAMMGYPDNFKTSLNPGTQAALDEITRAVMPPMAAWLARQLAVSLRGHGGPYELPAASRGSVLDLRVPPGRLEVVT